LFDQTYHGERVAQEDESRRMIGEVITNFFEGSINGLVFVLSDFVSVLIDQVYRRDG
jgi:hypothetical protein